MQSTTLKTEGIRELEQALVQLGKKAGLNALTGSLRDSAKPIVKAARQAAPRKTGKLRRGIRTETFRGKGVSSSNSVATLQIGFKRSTAWYGQILERGAKAHRIPNKNVGRGKNKRTNKVKLKIGDKVFSAVNHPGTKSYPILEDSFNSNYRKALQILQVRLRQRIILETIKKYGKSA